jgi:hypothetical protein
MGTTPPDFDWVTAKWECSASQVFTELRLGVEADIKKINKLRGDTPAKGVQLAKNGNHDVFEVWRDEPATLRVKFQRTGDRIEVRDGNGTLTAAYTVSFSVEGRCVLLASDGQMEQWQARRAALESLFFNS